MPTLSKTRASRPASAEEVSPIAAFSDDVALLILRAALEAMPLAAILVRDDGAIDAANMEAAHLFGFQADELLGKSIDTLVPERFRGDHPKHREEFFQFPVARRMGAGRDLRALRKDGGEFPVEIGLNPMRAGGKVYVLCIVADITERKRQEGWFRAAIEIAPIAMAFVNRQGKIVSVNPQTVELFGYSLEELLQQDIEVLIPQRYRTEHVASRDGYFANPSARPMGLGRTVNGRRKSGEEMELEVSLSPLAGDQGETMVLVMAVDVTHQRQREREREQNMAELARINRSLDEFAFMASHDLQEPLRKIASCCEVLREDYADKLDESGKEWLGFAIDGAQRIQAMVADLLAMSRLGRKAELRSPTSLDEACDTAVENLQMAIQESGATIQRQPLPTIDACRTEMVQLFQNLIGNAIRYRDQRPIVIEIGAERTIGGWRCHVRDNGIGIAPEFHERVFQIFQRLHQKEAYGGGTGIGLAIVKKVIDVHGGRIWIESRLGEGTTFYFTLPFETTAYERDSEH